MLFVLYDNIIGAMFNLAMTTLTPRNSGIKEHNEEGLANRVSRAGRIVNKRRCGVLQYGVWTPIIVDAKALVGGMPPLDTGCGEIAVRFIRSTRSVLIFLMAAVVLLDDAFLFEVAFHPLVIRANQALHSSPVGILLHKSILLTIYCSNEQCM